MFPHRSPKGPSGGDPGGGEPLSLERAEEVARELGIHPMGMRRMMERAQHAEWHAGPRKLVFTFPPPPPDDTD